MSLHRSKLFDVAGKTALVTGGGKGIGKMISQALVQNGANVYICSRKESLLTATASELNTLGPGRCFPLAGDLSTLAGIQGLTTQLKAREKHLHILVNNSGCTWGAPLESYPDQAWDKVMTLNVKSVFQLTVEALPLLEAAGTLRDPARVINIGSVTGLAANAGLWPEMYAYTTSKAAVHHLTQSLASKLTARGITVNAVACGAFATQMMAQTLAERGEVIANASPLGRIGEPSDIAGAVLFLASQAGSWMSGTVIPLEGGSLVSPSLPNVK